MPGSLYLGCGNAADEASLWKIMLQRPMTRIVYWPFALPPQSLDSAEDWLRSSLSDLGVGYSLDTWQRLQDHSASELTNESVDLHFVGGGNTFRLLDIVRRSGFVEPVRCFHRCGGDYYGGSAGAVLACDSIEIADGHNPNEPGLHDLSALGLLSGATILPHFTDGQLPDAIDWARARRAVVLGLPESLGLYCSDGRLRITGRGHLSRITSDAVQMFHPGDEITFTQT